MIWLKYKLRNYLPGEKYPPITDFKYLRIYLVLIGIKKNEIHFKKATLLALSLLQKKNL